MNRFHLVIIALFVVALGTGVVVGMSLSRPAQAPDRHSYLVRELGLTSAQSEQMRAIWADMEKSGAPHRDRMRTLRKERDDAIVALLTPEQKAAYDKIVEHYSQQVAEMNKERDAAFQAAVEKTKAILNAEQRAKYDELLKKGFRGRGGTTRGAGSRPATTIGPSTGAAK